MAQTFADLRALLDYFSPRKGENGLGCCFVVRSIFVTHDGVGAKLRPDQAGGLIEDIGSASYPRKGRNCFGASPSYVAGPDVAQKPRRTLPRVGTMPDSRENGNRWRVVSILKCYVVHALTTYPGSADL